MAPKVQRLYGAKRKARQQPLLAEGLSKKQFVQPSTVSTAIQGLFEGWNQSASQFYNKASVRPPSQFEKDVTVGLYLAWGFLLFLFVLWIVA